MQNNVEFNYNPGVGLPEVDGGWMNGRAVDAGYNIPEGIAGNLMNLEGGAGIYDRQTESFDDDEFVKICLEMLQLVHRRGVIIDVVRDLAIVMGFVLVYRAVQYFYLSLKYRVQESDMPAFVQQGGLLAGYCAMMVTIDLALGAWGVLMFIIEMMRVPIIALAPYSVSNFIKDLEYISGERDFSTQDFCRRALVWLGLGCTGAFYMAHRAIEQTWGAYSRLTLQRELSICFPAEVLESVGILSKEEFETFGHQVTYLQIFGMLVAKMALDLVVVAAQRKGWVNDLRNPVGISRGFMKRCGLKFKKQEAKEESERRQLVIAREALENQRKRAAQEARKTKEPQQESLKRPEASQQEYPTAQPGSTNFKREVMASHGKSSRKRTGRRVPVKRAKQAPKNVPDVATMKFELKGGRKVEFVRLFGFGCEGKNIWGVIPEGVAGAENMRMYRNTLAGGHVKARHSIAYDKHASDFKLRSNSNARLHGGVALSSKGLHRYMDDKDAGHIFDTLKGLGQAGEVMQLVVFNREVLKHKK